VFVSYQSDDGEQLLAIVTKLHGDGTAALRVISPDGRDRNLERVREGDEPGRFTVTTRALYDAQVIDNVKRELEG
jgi:hypothetical protein